MRRASLLFLLLATAADAGSGTHTPIRPTIAGNNLERYVSGRTAPVFRLLPLSGTAPTECSGAAITGTMGEAITIGRSSTAYCTKSDGTLVSVAANAPRVSKFGDTYGLLSEPGVTNDLWPSRDFTNARWVRSNVTCTKTATGVDGAANSASTCTATAANGTVLQSLTLAAAQRTGSFIIKRRTGTGPLAITRDGTTFTTLTGTQCKKVSPLKFAALPSSAFWTRCYVSSNVLNPVVGIRIATSGDAIDIDFGQDEDDPDGIQYPSSPILTTTASASRGAEQISVTAPAAMTNALGCVGADFYIHPTAGVLYIFGGSNTLPMFMNDPTLATNDNTNQASISVTQKMGGRLAWGVATWSTAANQIRVGENQQAFGVSAAYDNTIVPPTFFLGSTTSGTNALAGYITNVRFGTTIDACRQDPFQTMVTLGDSTVENPPPLVSWTSMLNTMLGSRWRLTNGGLSGDRLGQIKTRYDSTYRNRSYVRGMLLGGINDIVNASDAATTFGLWQTLADEMRADGLKVTALTILPCTSCTAGQRTVLASVNASILSYCAAHPSDTTCVDVYAEFNDGSGNYANAAYTTDGLHPSQAAVDRIAEMIKASLP